MNINSYVSAIACCSCFIFTVVADAAPPRVKLTNHGAVLADGKPFLPLFVWAQPIKLLEQWRVLGINSAVPGEKPEIDPPKAYLDKLNAAGMMGLFGVEMMNKETIGHPALLAWMVEHEADSAKQPAYVADLSGDPAAIWLEGEAAEKNTIERSEWLDKEHPQLSGGHWLTTEKGGTGQAEWSFKVEKPGTYHLWVREFTKPWANPTRWVLDNNKPVETPRDLPLSGGGTEVIDLGGGQGVAWANYGEVNLTVGKHTLTFEIAPGRTLGNPETEPGKDAIWAVDAICFTTVATHPPAKPSEPQPIRLPKAEKDSYDKVKTADSNALTWNVLTAGFYGPYSKLPMRYYEEFIRWTDIVTFDHYPITGWNKPDRLPEVGLATARLVALSPKNKPVWTIVEACDQDLAWTAKDTRGPTPAEMRAEVWSAIANGAKGIGYFTIAFNPFRWDNVTAENKAEMKRTNSELTELAAPICLGDTGKTLTVTNNETADKEAIGGAIHAVRKEYGGKTYVIAVNVTRAPVTPIFQLADCRAKQAAAWKENRTIKVQNGSFSDTFEPLAVHVYVLD